MNQKTSTTQLLLPLLFILISFTFAEAQGIRGNIVDDQNEVLPFATIYVRNIETGTTSNAE